MATKEQIVAAIRYGCAEVRRFAERLPDDERSRIGVAEQWSARDLLSHVIESMNDGAERLRADARGEPVEDPIDNDVHNAQMIADYRQRTWPQVRAALDDVEPKYVALVETLSEEQLNDPQRHPRLQGRPIWRNITANVLAHPLAFHLRPWYTAHGEAAYATQQAEDEARLAFALSDDPEWRGNVLYNLACHYALAGEKEAALQKLEAALGSAPNYAEYARGDPDFASLRGVAEFEALIAA